MTPVEWTAILAAAGGIVELAIRLARTVLDDGRCTVEGCPPRVRAKLAAADIPPAGAAVLAARAKAEIRAEGLDRTSIERMRRDADDRLATARPPARGRK